jgi:hypothetical protein
MGVVLLFIIKDEFSVRISSNSGETNGLIIDLIRNFSYIQALFNT